jgi:Zn-dependent peptidase ImmA (M78 family)
LTSISLNIKRLQHLLDLYSLTKEDFLLLLNKDRKRPLTQKDIFKSEIKIDILKKIDKIFNKGLNYYINPDDLTKSKDESIFFRKQQFNADPNFASKKIINQFEEEKISISSISKLSDVNLDRLLPIYSIKDNPQHVAKEVSNSLYPKFNRDLKEFLKAIISKLADQNILVFEFVETWNKKEKANVEGIYLSPNVIVLKRLQKAFRREIFTLSHELGHYLIDEEEVDEKISEYAVDYFSLNQIERWCNDFAFFFLAQDYSEIIGKLDIASEKNDYHNDILETITERTNLSLIALYTRLLINNKISQKNYKVIKEDLYKKFLAKEDEEKQKKELEKATGKEIKGSTPKPIQSPLLVKTMQFAFLEGIINEVEFCRRLNLKPNKLELFLQ